MKEPGGKMLLQILIDLYAEQENINIKYILEEEEND